jgi:NAD(P)-dependent dehydrogenase (short-subunit alcohol dehydrogenase family)
MTSQTYLIGRGTPSVKLRGLIRGIPSEKAKGAMQAGSRPYPAPPFPRQDQSKLGATPVKRTAQPEAVAPAYAFLVLQQCSSYITGEIPPIIGGYSGG